MKKGTAVIVQIETPKSQPATTDQSHLNNKFGIVQEEYDLLHVRVDIPELGLQRIILQKSELRVADSIPKDFGVVDSPRVIEPDGSEHAFEHDSKLREKITRMNTAPNEENK